jgi:putative acetyltransferase
MAIRQARPDDAPRVIQIWCGAVDATHHFLTSEDRAAIEAEVRDFLPHAPLWLSVDDRDKPLGFMLLDGPKMEALFVDSAFHGRGVGRALVSHALSQRAALKTDVNEANTQAVRFYERMGFTRTGRSEVDGQGRPYPLIHLVHRPQVQAP